MRRGLIFMLGFCLLPSAQAQDLKTAQRNVDAERQATLRKDVPWFEKTQTTDYFEISLQGRRTSKADALASMRNIYKVLTVKTLSVKVTNVQKVGEKSLYMVDVHLAGTMAGKGRSFPIDVTSTVIEAWAQIGGQWRMLSQKTTSQQTRIDGKLIRN